MKTTVDLPEDLLHRAKITAAQRKTTLKELVLDGLEYVIRHGPEDPAAERKARAAKLVMALGKGRNAEAVGRVDREEIYDRQDRPEGH